MHARDRKSNANVCVYIVSPSQMRPGESVCMSTSGWITRLWSVGPLLPKLLREREEERLTKSTLKPDSFYFCTDANSGVLTVCYIIDFEKERTGHCEEKIYLCL
jgi:hypothetical protein